MNVDVIEDARLLRLTPEHLENLLRRKPRIAAIVFRNLNKESAEQLYGSAHQLQGKPR